MGKSDLDARLQALVIKQRIVDSAWQETDQSQLLPFFVELIPLALSAERCSIFVLDPATDNVWLKCGTELEERQVKVPKGESMVGQVITSGEAQIETDMENRVGSHEYIDMQTGFISRNAICVPIHSVDKKKVTGAIQVMNKKGLKIFNGQDKSVLDQLSFQVSIFIANNYLKQQWIALSTDMCKVLKMLETK